VANLPQRFELGDDVSLVVLPEQKPDSVAWADMWNAEYQTATTSQTAVSFGQRIEGIEAEMFQDFSQDDEILAARVERKRIRLNVALPEWNVVLVPDTRSSVWLDVYRRYLIAGELRQDRKVSREAPDVGDGSRDGGGATCELHQREDVPRVTSQVIEPPLPELRGDEFGVVLETEKSLE
jgi:hypothetical protein